MIKMEDIARVCGVSKSTVSLALNMPHKISKAKRELIVQTAKEMGYFDKKAMACTQALLVIPDFAHTYFDTYYNEVLFGIINTLQTDRVIFQLLSSFNVIYSDIYKNQGIIFLGDTPKSDIARAKTFRLPFVLCGHMVDDPEVHSVRFDFEDGFADLLKYAQSCGHKNIALIRGTFEQEHYYEKLVDKVYLKSMKSKDNTLICPVKYSDLQTIEIAVNTILKAKPKITAILCSDDFLAYATMKVLKKLKVAVPGEMSIMGFDGINLPIYLEAPVPALTTVSVDRRRLGEESVLMLKRMINKFTIKNKQELLPVTLQVRDSVKTLR